MAVVLVILAHFVPLSGDGSVWERVISRGGFGVEIFFVLSGFLITHLLVREESAKGRISIRLFYFRRALRILPPLVLYLAFLVTMQVAGLLQVPTVDLLAGLFFVRNFVGTSADTGHLWTLAIEEQFYLVWPIALVLIVSSKVRLVIACGVVCISPFWRQLSYRLAGGAENVNTWRTDLRMEPLAIGAVLALLLSVPRTRSFLVRPTVRGIWFGVAALAILGAANLTSVFDVPIFRAFVPTVCWICIAVVINCSIHEPRGAITSVLEFRPLVWLGMLSYSLYLWQQPFAPHIITGATPKWFQEFPVNLLFAFGLAICSYYLVERPVLSLRYRFRREPHEKRERLAEAVPPT